MQRSACVTALSPGCGRNLQARGHVQAVFTDVRCALGRGAPKATISQVAQHGTGLACTPRHVPQ